MDKKNKRVLVVEDQDDLRETIREVLEDEGYQVEVAENGKVASKMIQDNENEYAAVVSDFLMPEMNGVELLAWCKKNNPIPFIVMTAYAEILTTHKAQAAGASAFIPKPFERQDLLDSLAEATDEESPEQNKE